MSILNNQGRNLKIIEITLNRGKLRKSSEKRIIFYVDLKKWKLFVNAEIGKEPNWEGEYQKQSYRRYSSS